MSQESQRPIFPLPGFWRRLPVLIRAVVIGLVAFAIVGSVVWGLVLALVPPPWSIVAMIIVLLLYWHYVRGAWWPQSTAALRTECTRRTALARSVWVWGIVAALAGAVLLQAALVVTFRLVEFPADAWALPYDFSALPKWQVWLLLVLAAAVAGITEEVGFRGFMQVPLETRYGPVAAITIVSIMFTIMHLNQAWAGGILVVLFAVSVMWGVLARVSGSLVPGIISHASTDIVNFAYWWTDVAGSFDRRPIGQTGIDVHFSIALAAFLLLLGLFVVAARKTLLARREADSR